MSFGGEKRKEIEQFFFGTFLASKKKKTNREKKILSLSLSLPLSLSLRLGRHGLVVRRGDPELGPRSARLRAR